MTSAINIVISTHFVKVCTLQVLSTKNRRQDKTVGNVLTKLKQLKVV